MPDETPKPSAPDPALREDDEFFDDPAYTAPVKPDDPAMLRLLSGRAKRSVR